MYFEVSGTPDVFSDACLLDEDGRLMFISLYGRDGAIQHLIAAFSLPRDQGGMPQFEVIPKGATRGDTLDVQVADAKRLTKFTGRIPDTMFGDLVHVWIFDRALAKPDRAARHGWVVIPQAREHTEAYRAMLRAVAWSIVKELSSVPLLDHWQDIVLRRLTSREACVVSGLSVGRISGLRITLPEDFPFMVSALVKEGAISLVVAEGEPARDAVRKCGS